LADARDLGLRNRGFHGIAFRFEELRFFIGKRRFFFETGTFANDE